jgi:hypothetical protein
MYAIFGFLLTRGCFITPLQAMQYLPTRRASEPLYRQARRAVTAKPRSLEAIGVAPQ